MARLTSGFVASALIREAHARGGFAAVLARGDAEAGALLLLLTERGADPRFFERGLDPSGKRRLIATGPASLPDSAAVTDYWSRRRQRDPDLWVIELDIAGAERFAAETIGDD